MPWKVIYWLYSSELVNLLAFVELPNRSEAIVTKTAELMHDFKGEIYETLNGFLTQLHLKICHLRAYLLSQWQVNLYQWFITVKHIRDLLQNDRLVG